MAKDKEMTDNSVAVVPSFGNFPALNMPEADITEIMKENFSDDILSPYALPKVTVPTAGGKFWTMNDAEGEKAVKTFDGIVVAWAKGRTYYVSKDPVKGELPQCYSRDCVIGHGVPGGECKNCSFSTFGPNSEPQTCKEHRLLAVLTGTSILPFLVKVPTTGIVNFKNYMTKLTSAGNRFYGVITTFGLEGATSKTSKVDYSRPTFNKLSNVPEHLLPRVAAYKQYWQGVLNAGVNI